MAADNGLSDAALSDLNEMEAANFDEDKIKILVLTDLLDTPTQERHYEDSRIFDIHHDDDKENVTSPVFKYEGEYDSGNYNTLVDFANWGFSKYPSLHKALFIWSHGNGWYSYYDKFCIDHSSGSFFNIPNGDLKNAFDKISSKVEILGLDACNMQCLEVLTEIKDNVYYTISSETEIPSDGFPYDDIFTNWVTYLTAKTQSIQIGENIYSSYLPGGSQNIFSSYIHFSVSSIEIWKYNKFLADLKIFLNGNLEEIKSEIIAARDNCYTDFIDMDYASQIDILDFFKNLLDELNNKNEFQDKVDAIIDDLEKIFIYHNQIELSYKVGYATVWFPTNYSTYLAMLSDYSKLEFFKTGWNNILELYFSNNVDKKSKENFVKTQ